MSDLIPIGDYGDILEAIAATIRGTGRFKPAAKIEPAPGPLSENWLKENSLPHGGALTAVAGINSIKRNANATHWHDLNLGLYLIPAPQQRGRQAKDLAQDVSEIIGLISLNRWELSGVKAPTNLRAANRYSATLDRKGSTLWTIDWRQEFMLVDQISQAVDRDLVSGGSLELVS